MEEINKNDQTKKNHFSEDEREKLIYTIKRLDNESIELQERLSRLEHVIIKMVDRFHFDIFNVDLEYIFMKYDISSEKSNKSKALIFDKQIAYKETGKVPTFLEFHEELLNIMSIEEDKKDNISFEVTTMLLKKYGDIDNYFPVTSEILRTK